jgi:predicted CXXCH cytochrome family protein
MTLPAKQIVSAAILLVADVVHSAEIVCELPVVQRALTTTTTCYGCHDGTVASSTLHGTNDHPVDVVYEEVRETKAQYAMRLPPALVLVRGRVTCTTCHEYRGDASYPHWTAMSMVGSALCLACHEK